MFVRRSILFTHAVSLAVSLWATLAFAEDGHAECHNLSSPAMSGWLSHDEVTSALRRIEHTSQGRVRVEVIGQSLRGRDIHAARVGTGDRVLLVTSEIHGNEKTGTIALVQILEELGSSSNPEIEALLRGVTLVAVPMFNADGGMLNRRQNDYPWAEVTADFPQLSGAPPAWYYSLSRGGFDVNRDFNANLAYEPRAEDLPGADAAFGFYLTRESRALRALYQELRAEFGEVHGYVDLHHMGPCNQIVTDGQYVSVALDYPPLGPDGNPKYAAWPLLDQAQSRRYALAAYLGMRGHAGDGQAETSPFLGGVARYIHPLTRDLPGQARCSFAMNGTATVLFEVRGQSDAWGQKQMGVLTQVVRAGVLGILSRMADGSIDALDDAQFFQIPKYDW
jgi:hypothetical protein